MNCISNIDSITSKENRSTVKCNQKLKSQWELETSQKLRQKHPNKKLSNLFQVRISFRRSRPGKRSEAFNYQSPSQFSIPLTGAMRMKQFPNLTAR